MKEIRVLVDKKWVKAIINSDGSRTIYCDEHDQWYAGLECPKCRAERTKAITHLPWYKEMIDYHGQEVIWPSDDRTDEVIQ